MRTAVLWFSFLCLCPPLSSQILDRSWVVGELELVEGSMRCERREDNYARTEFHCCAEIVNNTNAVVKWVTATLTMFNTSGRKMGTESWSHLPRDQEFGPGETFPYGDIFHVLVESSSSYEIPDEPEYRMVFWHYPVRPAPASPDSVWVEPAEDLSFVLAWPSVEGAMGYRVYRYLSMHVRDRDTTEYRWVEWQTVGQGEGVIRIPVATLDQGPRFGDFAVTTVIEESGETLESRKAVITVDLTTSIQRASWGEIKNWQGGAN